MSQTYTIESVGEFQLIITFGTHVDSKLPPIIRHSRERLLTHFGRRLLNAVPSYTTLLLEFEPLSFDEKLCKHRVLDCLHLSSEDQTNEQSGKLVVIPTYYGPEVALDWKRYQNLSLSQIAHLHSSQEYLVHALGFSAGFAFMAEVPPSLHLSRLPVPRSLVPKGSIGIAGNQTAIYPQDSPGGWNIIGRTTLDLYKPLSRPMTLLEPGDTVRFEPIGRQQYLDSGGVF